MENGEDALAGDIENLSLDRPPVLSHQHPSGIPQEVSLSAATDIDELINTEDNDDLLAEKEQVFSPVNDNVYDDEDGIHTASHGITFQIDETERSTETPVNELEEQNIAGPEEQETVEIISNKLNNTISCLKAKSPERVKGLKRNVSFPDGPNGSVVTLIIDPVDPWKDAKHATSADVISLYKKTCEKMKTKPIDKLIRQIQDHPDLTCRIATLSLKGTKLDTKACESLETIFKRVQFEILDLENCSLEEEAATAILEMVEFYQSACKINLAYNPKMGMRGWQTLCRMLRKTPCVYYLDARRTMLTDQTMPMFGRCLKADPFLRILHLEGIFLSGRPLLILTTAMKYNTILEELYLGDNDLTSADGVSIGAMLSANRTLQLLDLRNNALRDPGLVHLANGLVDQANVGENGIVSLVLWNINLSHEAMFHFSDAMAKTQSLKSLNLGHNRIGDIGVQKLKPGLIRNRSLRRLGLLNTKLGNEGAVALAEILADSISLTRIDVRENNVQVAGLMALSLALKVNRSLVRLDLDKEMRKEPGLETVQQTVLSDVYNYCYRNKQLAKDSLSRQSSVSEDSETSLTEENGTRLRRCASAPAVTTTGEAAEGIVTTLKSLVTEAGPIKNIVGSITTLTFNSTTATAAIPKNPLPSSKHNDMAGRNRFTITRIMESIGNVSTDVAHRIAFNVGLETVALSRVKKNGRTVTNDHELESMVSKSNRKDVNNSHYARENEQAGLVLSACDTCANETENANKYEHIETLSEGEIKNSNVIGSEDNSLSNAVSNSADLPPIHVDHLNDSSSVLEVLREINNQPSLINQ